MTRHVTDTKGTTTMSSPLCEVEDCERGGLHTVIKMGEPSPITGRREVEKRELYCSKHWYERHA